MDRNHFDILSRRLAAALTRRGVIRRGQAVVALVLSTRALTRDLRMVEAKRKRKKKRRKKRRKPGSCRGACHGSFPKCCPATTQDPRGFCAGASDVCCTSAGGSGACPAEMPTCCPPTTQHPDGLCGNPDDSCCPSDKGGFLCPPGRACCATNDDCPQDATCDQHCCLPEGAPRLRRARVTHEVRRRTR